MNYVDSFDLFGVQASQIPCIRGSGAPTTATEGAVGCLYMDTDTGTLYKCTASAGGIYEWSRAESDGMVKTVNGVAPDKNGNVDVVDIGVSDEQIAQAVSAYMAENPVVVEGYVKTVNGNAPDASGNVTVEGGGGTVTDDHINSLIDAKLGVIENGAY